MTAADTARAGLLSRMRRGILASGMGFVMRLLLQLVQVPLFLSFWGVEYFGEWLLLFAFTGLLGLLDLGVCGAGANGMAQQISKGAQDLARRMFTVVITVVGGSIILFSLLGLILWAAAGDSIVAQFAAIAPETVTLALVGLMLAAWLQLAVSALGTVLRAVGQYAEQTTLGTIMALAELCAVALALVLGGGAVLVAGSILLSRLFIAGLAARMSWRAGAALMRPEFTNYRATLRGLTAPSLSYLLFPATNAINLQGIAAIVGLLLGPVALASLATLRTLARLVDIIPDMLVGIITAEAAYAKGRENMQDLLDMSAVATLIITIIAMGGAAFLFFFGDLVYETWTAGTVAFNASLLVMLLAARILRASYLPNASILFGMNIHANVGIASFVIHLAAVALLGGLILAGLGVIAVPLSLLAIEVALFATVFHEFARRTGLPITKALFYVLSPATGARAIHLVTRVTRRGLL